MRVHLVTSIPLLRPGNYYVTRLPDAAFGAEVAAAVLRGIAYSYVAPDSPAAETIRKAAEPFLGGTPYCPVAAEGALQLQDGDGVLLCHMPEDSEESTEPLFLKVRYSVSPIPAVPE